MAYKGAERTGPISRVSVNPKDEVGHQELDGLNNSRKSGRVSTNYPSVVSPNPKDEGVGINPDLNDDAALAAAMRGFAGGPISTPNPSDGNARPGGGRTITSGQAPIN